MQKNNQLVNLLFNIVLPFLILTKLSSDQYLGPIWGLVVALAFPLFFGLYELIFKKQRNFISLIGFVGVLLSGVIGLLKLPPHWIAVKESLIPFVIGVFVLVSTKKPWQLITKILYNPEFLDINTIEEKLAANGLKGQMDKMLNKANMFLSYSFFFSAVMNYLLAKVIVRSMPGTVEFNEELGRMTMLSFPVIALPSMVIMVFVFRYMLNATKAMTQLSTNEILSEKLRSDK